MTRTDARSSLLEESGLYGPYLICVTFLVVVQFWRADERTRTADLLITSDNSGVAGVCTRLQIPHIQAVSSSPVCPALHRIALPVVSEWCQYHPRIGFAGQAQPPHGGSQRARRTDHTRTRPARLATPPTEDVGKPTNVRGFKTAMASSWTPIGRSKPC